MTGKVGDLTKNTCFNKANKRDAAATLKDYVKFRTPFYASTNIKPMPNTLFNLKHWVRWHPNVIVLSKSGEGLLSVKGFLEALTSPRSKSFQEPAKENQDFNYLKDLYQHKLIIAATGSDKRISEQLKEELQTLRTLMLKEHRPAALEYALSDPLLENFFGGEPKDKAFHLPDDINHLVALPRIPPAYFLPPLVTHSESLVLSFKLLSEALNPAKIEPYAVVNSSEFPLHLVKNSLDLNIQGPTSDAPLMQLLIEKFLSTEKAPFFEYKPDEPSHLLTQVFKKASISYQALK